MGIHDHVTSYQQCCDSYFTETLGMDGSAPRHFSKEHAEHTAQERQQLIAEQLSQMDAKEYQNDILDHMLQMDNATLPDVDSIDIQTEIQWFMRPYLLDFLIEAHSAFQLLPETLFLTVNLLDRYCSKRVVYKRHYQLVGCAALLIAAKYGDKKEKVPTIKELKSMCCSLYDDDMFLQMEWHVLQTLGWSVGHPTVDSFLQLAIKDGPADPETEHVALYILEIALFHREFVSKLSSHLARSALALARCILGREQAPHYEWASQYDSMILLQLSQQLHQPSQVLSRKYASAHYYRVSKLVSDFLARQAILATASAPLTPLSEASPVATKPAYTTELGFSTPQKNQYPAVMSNGYPTPPITPDGEYFYGLPKAQAVQSGFPPTPTPPSSAEQPHFGYRSQFSSQMNVF